MNNLILIGFKSAGKTTLGKKVSSVLNKPFIDTDDLLKEDAALLYHRIGEEAFRRREKEALRTIEHVQGHVIATGGGIVLDADNRQLLKNLGCIVHLHTLRTVIEKRLGAHHPFLIDYENRLGIYNTMAHHTIINESEIWEVIRSDPFSE